MKQDRIIPTPSDPDHVRETYVNGPINISTVNGCATFTYTIIRGDMVQMMSGQTVNQYEAVVVSRITMPAADALELRDLLNRVFPAQPTADAADKMIAH